jgi:hypothetical protein
LAGQHRHSVQTEEKGKIVKSLLIALLGSLSLSLTGTLSAAETGRSAMPSVLFILVDELGLTDRTVVCFTSDNGGVTSGDSFSSSQLPYRGGKGRQWEAFIVGRRIGRYRHVSDYAPSPEVELIRRDLINRFGTIDRGILEILAHYV